MQTTKVAAISADTEITEVCVLLVQYRICVLIPRLSLLCLFDYMCGLKSQNCCQESRSRELGGQRQEYTMFWGAGIYVFTGAGVCIVFSAECMHVQS